MPGFDQHRVPAGWVRLEPDGFAWGATASCFALLLLASVQLLVLLFWMLRRTARLCPRAAILGSGLAVAALTSCALSLLNVFEALAMVLLWNFDAAALVSGVDAARERRVLGRSAETRFSV